MALLIGLPALLLTALLLNAAFPARGRLANLLALACLSYAQIVLLSELLSELHLMTAAGYLAGHGVLLAGAVLWWRSTTLPLNPSSSGRGTSNPSAAVSAPFQILRQLTNSWWIAPADLWRAARQNPLLSLFAVVVLAFCVANLLLSAVYPTHGADEVAYHLSRVYFWAQQQTARHFVTFDPRQVEFPPDGSFSFLWLMLLSGSTVWLHLPEWWAGLVLAVGTAGLVRLAGQSRRAALFTGLVLLTTTGTILQMATRHSDLLTAAMSVIFLYFALRTLQKGRWRSPELAYAGLAFGLALGSKLTVFLLLPGVALALLVYGWRRQGPPVLRTLVALALSAAIGFALLGAYNYVLNFADFGSPISSRPLSDSSAINEGTPRRPNLYGLGTNLIRYYYQMMDWDVWGLDERSPLFIEHQRLYQTISQWSGLNPESVPEFTYYGIGIHSVDVYGSGFGLIFYAILIVSPLLLLVFLWRARRSRRYDLALALLLIAWSWILLTAGILPWDPYRPRFFLLVVPLLLAAALPWLVLPRRIALLWLIPLALIALWSAGHTTFAGFARLPALLDGIAPDREHLAEISPHERDFLHTILPPGSTLALTGGELRMWDFLNALPEYHFRLVPGPQIEDYLATNDTGLMLAPIPSCTKGDQPYLYFSLNPLFSCLIVASPEDFLQQPSAVAYYGYQRIQTAHENYMLLDPAQGMVNRDEFRVDVSIPVNFFGPGDLQIDISYANGTIAEDDLISLNCNDQPAIYTLREDGVSFTLAQSVVQPLQVFQHCQVLHQYNPALKVASVLIYRQHPPPPDTLLNLRFEHGPTLLAGDLPDSAPPCGTLYLSFWWSGLADGLDQTLYLVDARKVPLLESHAALTITGGFSRRFINLPCDLAPGDYDLLMRVYSGSTALNLADGSGTIVHLGTISVRDSG